MSAPATKAATAAGQSKIQAFLNHPAGEFCTSVARALDLSQELTLSSRAASLDRTQDGVLLGSHVQVVSVVTCRRLACASTSCWNSAATPKTQGQSLILLLKRCRGLVAAGLKDLSRPADKISIPQNLGTLSPLSAAPPSSACSPTRTLIAPAD